MSGLGLSTFGYLAQPSIGGEYFSLRRVVQGPAARMCKLSVSSWGAEVSVKGWYSVVPRARQAIRTHCPDLYSKPWGRWNCRWVTPEEGRWAGGCCPEPYNSVASRE